MIKKEWLKNSLEKMYINAADNELNKLMQYLELLYEGNKKFNITGTKEKEAILIRHILDSLGIFYFFNLAGIGKHSKLKILDIGTGGGLPGIPLAILLENSEVFMLDSKGKIIDFLKEVTLNLGLSNAIPLNGRAEILAHDNKHRESFDIVTARAFGPVALLSEIMVPFCKIGGRAVMYKSKKLNEELKDSAKKIEKLGAIIDENIDIKIPYLDEYRTLLILKKEFSTLYKYPRKYDKMLKMQVFI